MEYKPISNDYNLVVNEEGSKYSVEMRGPDDIKVINQTKFRANIKAVLDDVCDGKTVLVTRKAEDNVVIISEKEYNEYRKYVSIKKQEELPRSYAEALKMTKVSRVCELKEALEDIPDDLKVDITISRK